MYNGCCKYEVVNYLVFEVFSCKPTRLSSTTSNSNIPTSSFHDFANNKRSSAYRIFVSLSTAPTCRLCDFKDCFQFRMACSRIEQHTAQNITLLHSTCDVENTIAAVNNSGLSSVQPAQHLKVRVWNSLCLQCLKQRIMFYAVESFL